MLGCLSHVMTKKKTVPGGMKSILRKIATTEL